MWMHAEDGTYFNAETGASFGAQASSTTGARVVYNSGTGLSKVVMSGYRDKAEAEAALDEFVSGLDEGKVVHFPKPTTDEERGEEDSADGVDRGPNVEKSP